MALKATVDGGEYMSARFTVADLGVMTAVQGYPLPGDVAQDAPGSGLTNVLYSVQTDDGFGGGTIFDLDGQPRPGWTPNYLYEMMTTNGGEADQDWSSDYGALPANEVLMLNTAPLSSHEFNLVGWFDCDGNGVCSNSKPHRVIAVKVVEVSDLVLSNLASGATVVSTNRDGAADASNTLFLVEGTNGTATMTLQPEWLPTNIPPDMIRWDIVCATNDNPCGTEWLTNGVPCAGAACSHAPATLTWTNTGPQAVRQYKVRAWWDGLTKDQHPSPYEPIRIAYVNILKVELDVDSDRNGTVDGTDAEDSIETNSPAIIIVNNDDADTKHDVDTSDNIVNGTEDVSDLAELVIRSIPALPTGWKAVLSVPSSDAEHMRIFDSRSTTATARIGPVGSGLSNEYEIPDVSSNLTYGVEAIDYASTTYSGTTTVSVIVKRADNSEFARNEVKLKVAPFLLLPSTRPAETIYVSNADTNFVAQLKTAVGAGKVVEVSSTTYKYPDGTPDVWVQDEVELGYIQRPANTTMPVVWDLPRNGPLDDWPEDCLRGTNFGFFAEGSAGSASAEFGGNLECTPPVTVSGTEYKFGRALVSTDMDSSLTHFIEHQGIQAPIIELNASWLTVGHVDEVVAFVPSGGGFKILIADTDCAIDLLKNLNTDNTGTASAGSSNILADASKSWTVNQWQDGFVRITAGTGNNQVRQVASNTSTSIVPKIAWTTSPSTNSQYEVVARSAYRCLFFENNEDLGVASAATMSTLTDSSKSWPANTWAGGHVRIVAGTGSGQDPVEISANTSTQLTLSANWATTPDDTSRFVVVQKSKKWNQTESWKPALITVREILSDTALTNNNHTYQTSIDSIRTTLKTELGIGDSDFIAIPSLFRPHPLYGGAVAYVPGMVNLLVDGSTLVPAKPFGPHDGGVDVFENDVTSKLTGFTVYFIDDWDRYHRWDGEIHCGTNAKRTPLASKWWE